MWRKVRLVKYLAERGMGSRRFLDRWIQERGVCLNDVCVFDPAMQVSEADHIVMDGAPVPSAKPARRVWAFYKPRGVLTTHHDDFHRPSVFDVFKGAGKGLKTVGRLDQESEGLLLLTNDGAFKRFLELPRHRIARVYHVHYRGGLTPDMCAQARAGLTIKGVHYAPCSIQPLRNTRAQDHQCAITLYEGKNREIRKILGFWGCEVRRLIRTRYGGVSLGRLTPGAHRQVQEKEIDNMDKNVP
ncbi:pseudouridine synthase [Candidatus Hepatobacter penaei]|uniref:pseudouridine synthase n=1 Tax=Candidatus Hepatobacter penaei TaxID=1274402 RepID=UPI0004F30AC9|nr:pseudouridine synthase [Candidatus Hepatobacter penaei]